MYTNVTVYKPKISVVSHVLVYSARTLDVIILADAHQQDERIAMHATRRRGLLLFRLLSHHTTLHFPHFGDIELHATFLALAEVVPPANLAEKSHAIVLRKAGSDLKEHSTRCLDDPGRGVLDHSRILRSRECPPTRLPVLIA